MRNKKKKRCKVSKKNCNYKSIQGKADFIEKSQMKTEEDSTEQQTAAEYDSERILELALSAGHILLENGAEIFRVEETIDRICHHYNMHSGSAFVLSNGIFMTAGGRKENFFAKVEHIPVSGTHLDKVAAVNQLSREIVNGRYTLEEAEQQLEQIRRMPPKRKWVQILASALGSASFCYLFGGGLLDSAVAFVSGLLLYLYVLQISVHLSKIVGNILGGALVTLFCSMMFQMGVGDKLNCMIIGSIMPLIPGVAFTNAIREMADSDYISGGVRMMDALLGFISIAIGVGMGTALLNWITGGTVI